MDLAFVLVTLRRAWWLLLLTAMLGIAGAAIVNVTSPVRYTATVQQFVSMTGQTDTPGTNSALSGAQFALQRVKSYTQIATSSQVLQPVIDQLGLPTTVGGLAGRVEAQNPLDTVLITLSVTDVDPRRAANTANAISVQLGKVVQSIEAPAGGGVSPVKVTVTEQATVPTVPVSPKVKLNLALGLLVGLGLGAGAALLRAQLDTRIAHVGDVEGITGRAPLGVVPFDGEAKAHPLIPSDQASPRAEAFRALRTNLRFADVDNPPRTIVVTSPLPAEGKSTSACNIALTLALNGSRVVLIEADLRKPRACAYLGLDSSVGLTSLLAGQHHLDDVLVQYQGGLLAVIPAGPVPPNPSELLGSQHMATTLRTLATSFDHVIIDTAPVLPMTDAAVLSNSTDGVLVIVKHGRTTRDELQRALQTLEAAKARVLGTVVNFAPIRKRSRGGYRYGGYAAYGRYGTTTVAAAPRPPAPAIPAMAAAPEPQPSLLPMSAPATTSMPFAAAGATPGESRPASAPVPAAPAAPAAPATPAAPAAPAVPTWPAPAGDADRARSGNGPARAGGSRVATHADAFSSPYTGSMQATPYHQGAVDGGGTAEATATSPTSPVAETPGTRGRASGQFPRAAQHQIVEMPADELPSYLHDPRPPHPGADDATASEAAEPRAKPYNGHRFGRHG